MKIKAMRKEKKGEEWRKEKWIGGATLSLLMKLMSPYETHVTLWKRKGCEGSKGIKHDID
jgi:hypothetical protein